MGVKPKPKTGLVYAVWKNDNIIAAPFSGTESDGWHRLEVDTRQGAFEELNALATHGGMTPPYALVVTRSNPRGRLEHWQCSINKPSAGEWVSVSPESDGIEIPENF